MTYLLTDISITKVYTNRGVFCYAMGTLIDDSDISNNPPTLPKYVTWCEGLINTIEEKASKGEKVYLENIFPTQVPMPDGQIITVYIHKIVVDGEEFWAEDPIMLARRIFEARNRGARVI